MQATTIRTVAVNDNLTYIYKRVASERVFLNALARELRVDKERENGGYSYTVKLTAHGRYFFAYDNRGDFWGAIFQNYDCNYFAYSVPAVKGKHITHYRIYY